MADKKVQDAATKQRIITHMNKEHHDSVIRYLQHFHKLSAFSAYDAQMTDVELNNFTITTDSKTYLIPLSPPMTSLAQVRDRARDLDTEARKALGQSDVTLPGYLPPTGKYAVGLIAVGLIAAAYSQRWWFAPGEIVEQYLGAAVAGFGYRIQPYFNVGLFSIHALETVQFYFQKLRKHSVNPRTTGFWLWIASTVIEGRFAFRRVDEYVKAQREKQKH